MNAIPARMNAHQLRRAWRHRVAEPGCRPCFLRPRTAGFLPVVGRRLGPALEGALVDFRRASIKSYAISMPLSAVQIGRRRRPSSTRPATNMAEFSTSIRRFRSNDRCLRLCVRRNRGSPPGPVEASRHSAPHPSTRSNFRFAGSSRSRWPSARSKYQPSSVSFWPATRSRFHGKVIGLSSESLIVSSSQKCCRSSAGPGRSRSALRPAHRGRTPPTAKQSNAVCVTRSLRGARRLRLSKVDDLPHVQRRRRFQRVPRQPRHGEPLL